MSPTISIAIVTRNRPNSLCRTLKSLRAQDVQPCEVIISDDSDDEMKKAVKMLARDFGCKWIQGPQRGLYANRNHSILACRGSHIRTMDDDHTFPCNHFAVLYELVCMNPESILTIGEVLSTQISDTSAHELSVHYPGQLHPRGFSYIPDELTSYYGISCGGTIYPRIVFDAGYRNSEKFLFGASYLEFGALLRFSGFSIRMVDNTYLVHHASPADMRRDAITIPALIFAILCHSFLYFPSLRNRLSTSVALARICVGLVGKGVLPAYWNQAFSAFQERRNFVLCRMTNHQASSV